MISIIRPNEAETTEDGTLLVGLGPVSLNLLASYRDQEEILDTDEDMMQIWTTCEFDGEEILMVGFHSQQRRDFYRTLRKIKGVGRQSAIKVLDCGSVDDTLRAVVASDSNYFKEVPGIGERRISQIIAQMQRVYRDELPRAVKCSIANWVVVRDAMVRSGMNEFEAEARLVTLLEEASTISDGDEMLEQLAASL